MVKRRREIFLQFSQIRGTIKKFAIVLAFMVAFVFMLLNKSENILIEKTSTTANEIVSSAVDVLVMPATALNICAVFAKLIWKTAPYAKKTAV